MATNGVKLPRDLEPQDWQKLELPAGAQVSIGVARPEFRRWSGAPIANTFGGKPLIDTGGVAEFAELAMLRCFERAGWDGRWLETYGAKGAAPYFLSGWRSCTLKEQPQNPLTDPEGRRLLNEIATSAGGFGGCWDVFAWRDGRYVFAEAKRARRDAIRGTQTRWLEAALACGCDESDFVLVEWTFSGA